MAQAAQTEESKGGRRRTAGNGEATGDKPKREKNPFRGALEGMHEDLSMQIELGMLDADAEVTKVVVSSDGVWGCTLKRLRAAGE